MAKTMTWALEDHLCRACGGRILRSVSGAGMTAGGNPVFKCADCGKATAASGPDALCWCGFSHRRNHHINAYHCLPFSLIESRPELEPMFKACGCDPKRGEVGVVLESDLRAVIEKADYHGGQFDIQTGNEKWVVTVTKEPS